MCSTFGQYKPSFPSERSPFSHIFTFVRVCYIPYAICSFFGANDLRQKQCLGFLELGKPNSLVKLQAKADLNFQPLTLKILLYNCSRFVIVILKI